jgi:hypothetical protein
MLFGDDTHVYFVRIWIYALKNASCAWWEKDIWHKNSIESNDMRVFPFETRKGLRLGMSLSKVRENRIKGRKEIF